MVNRNLIRNLDDEDIASELALLAPEDETDGWIMEWLAREQQDYAQGEIVDGKIVEVNDEWALVDVGFKSEGTVWLKKSFNYTKGIDFFMIGKCSINHDDTIHKSKALKR